MNATQDSYTSTRIEALKRNGAIAELRAEARKLRGNVVARFEAAEQYGKLDYDGVVRQLRRAEAFDAEATLLDSQRPAGAAGLAS